MNLQFRNNRYLAAALALAGALILGPAWLGSGGEPVQAHTAGFTVTRVDDPAPDGCDPADCSLREAIIAANTAPGHDTITLPSGIYVLTIAGTEDAAAQGDLDITAPLTLTGAGTDQTIIDAGGIDRIFDIGSNAVVSLSGISIINGSAPSSNGGGIRCQSATLTLENVVLRHNSTPSGLSGGGLYAYECAVTLSATRVLSNTAHDGGGIHVGQGALTLTHSTVARNVAHQSGGGIWNSSSATRLSYSTLFSNTAANTGGGLYQIGAGATLAVANSLIAGNEALSEAGGLFIGDNTTWATLENSTVSGNRTDGYGGGVNTRAPLTFTHATITDNWAGTEGVSNSGGGGLFAYQGNAKVEIQHTILAGNVDRNNAAYPDCRRWSATITSQGHNLVGMVGNCSFGAAGDITGQDARLGPLTTNGGPTWTHAPLVGSPAIDAGDATFAPPPLHDQRGFGFPRRVGRVDIGAFEVWKRVFLPLVLR